MLTTALRVEINSGGDWPAKTAWELHGIFDRDELG